MPALPKKDYDAIVIGSGPNGLAAAIQLQQSGLSVLLIEGNHTIGGGMRTQELTLAGYKHDVCSAIHPMAAASPFFRRLPLDKHGLEYVYPIYPAAHPFDDGTSSILYSSLALTAERLLADGRQYGKLISPILKNWPILNEDLLGPLRFPRDPIAMMRFGLKGLASAKSVSSTFQTEKAKSLWAGMAAHSIAPLEHPATSAIALVLMAVGHSVGWPFPKGGAQKLADALASYFVSIGGKIQTGWHVKSLRELPSSHALLFDLTPKQLLEIAGHRLSSIYSWQLRRYVHGPGVFKIDWALDGPVPWKSEDVTLAGTVHLGNTYREIAASERECWNGRHARAPFVLVAQHSQFDQTRAPHNKSTLWGYCHVPNGSLVDMTAAIENQVERFAPGFKKKILARHTMNTEAMNAYNANYAGGDINGGAMRLDQLFTRPALRFSPYRTSAKGIYICSSSTPPGGGVHGMCGFHAATVALEDVFGIK